MIIKPSFLKSCGACPPFLNVFISIFPNGMSVSKSGFAQYHRAFVHNERHTIAAWGVRNVRLISDKLGMLDPRFEYALRNQVKRNVIKAQISQLYVDMTTNSLNNRYGLTNYQRYIERYNSISNKVCKLEKIVGSLSSQDVRIEDQTDIEKVKFLIEFAIRADKFHKKEVIVR